MGFKLVPTVPEIALARAHVLKDEFYSYASGTLWTSLTTGGGASVAWSAGAGGLVLLTTGGTQNNEAAVATTNAVFTPAASKPLMYQSYVTYSEADTNNAAIAIGLSSLMNSAGLLADTTGVPTTSTSTAFLIYKVAGSTVWKCLTQIGTSQTISTSTATAGGAAQHYYQINVVETADSKVEVEFRVDDQVLIDSTTFRAIKHAVAFSGAVATKAGVFAKNAGSATTQTCSVDNVSCAQLR